MRNPIDNRQLPVGQSSTTGWQATCWLMLDRFLHSPAARSRTSPHIRDTANVQGILNNFVIATLPCWLLGMWNLGYQLNITVQTLELAVAPGWRGVMLNATGIGINPANILACIIHGLLYFLPVLSVVLLVSVVWEVAFAQLRRRPVDEGVLVFAWLFALLLPAGVPLFQAGLGISFGVIVGKHMFGGTGRYLVNPAVLGAAFLWLAYPELVFGEANWVPVPGYLHTAVLDLAVAGGIDAVLAIGTTWWDLFLGVRPGPMGMTSVLGCVLGAVYLLMTGSASGRVMVGVLSAVIATAYLLNNLEPGNNLFTLSWHWHLLLGGIAFGAVFLATDPIAGAATNPGRWAYGALVGLLALIMQATNSTNTLAIVFAVFLASMCAPIIDFVVVEWYLRRKRQRARALGYE